MARKATSKQRGKRSRKRATKRQRIVKPKLIHAMHKLKNMGASRRVRELDAAPDTLIRDMSTALNKARKKKNIKLPKGLAKQVKKHTKALRMISNPRLSIKKKRTLIKQKGGGILGTIARLIPVVGPVLGTILDSA